MTELTLLLNENEKIVEVGVGFIETYGEAEEMIRECDVDHKQLRIYAVCFMQAIVQVKFDTIEDEKLKMVADEIMKRFLEGVQGGDVLGSIKADLGEAAGERIAAYREKFEEMKRFVDLRARGEELKEEVMNQLKEGKEELMGLVNDKKEEFVAYVEEMIGGEIPQSKEELKEFLVGKVAEKKNEIVEEIMGMMTETVDSFLRGTIKPEIEKGVEDLYGSLENAPEMLLDKIVDYVVGKITAILEVVGRNLLDGNFSCKSIMGELKGQVLENPFAGMDVKALCGEAVALLPNDVVGEIEEMKSELRELKEGFKGGVEEAVKGAAGGLVVGGRVNFDINMDDVDALADDLGFGESLEAVKGGVEEIRGVAAEGLEDLKAEAMDRSGANKIIEKAISVEASVDAAIGGGE